MKKILLGIVLSITLFASFLAPVSFQVSNVRVSAVTPTYAADCGIDPACIAVEGLKSAVLAIFAPATNLSTLVENVVTFIMTTLAKAIGGNPQTQGLGPPKTVEQAYERYGAMGAIGLGVQEMYRQPPVTTADYLATINPIVSAHAKSGQDVLRPVADYWRLSRNLAYIFFVLVIVTIGLMVMFRSKIDPRTTVSVTAAIPGLIVSLILITFSLAFAGLIIDIGRIGMDLIRNLLLGTAGVGSGVPNIGSGVGLSPGDIWTAFIFNLNNGVSFGGFAGGIVGAFLSLVVMAFAFIVGIQVFMMLLFRYINLIIKPIFAPFTFLFGALPGRGSNIAGWFKSYLVDALTFPIVLLILNLALTIKNTSNVVSDDPFGVFIPGANLNSLIAIGILFLSTKVPAILEDALDIKPSSHVERSGSQPASMAKQIPILRNFL
jgi:hypothetical protein